MRPIIAVFVSVAAVVGLASLASPVEAAGHWACRDGAWIAVGAPGHPRPARACGERPAIPKSEAACRQVGGRWGRAGIFPTPICVVPTGDAGRVCGDGGECEGVCLADPTSAERARIAAGTPIALTGRCSERRPVFGCMYRVEAGMVRGRLCAD